MADSTSDIRKTMSKSIGAGAAAMFGGNKTYCILQHLTSTDKHRLGENQEIIVDYAELGRNSNCAIRYGEDCRTVSRVHAAIVKEGNNWSIHHKSTNNQTLVNDRPVNRRWFLNNGDIIQLSPGGPKLGFVLPQNPAVGSIGLSRRLSLFRQQALRPYKQAVIALSTVMVLAVGGLSFFLWQANKQIAMNKEDFKKAQAVSQQQAKENEQRLDSVRSVNADLQKEMNRIRSQVHSIRSQQRTSPPVSSGQPDTSAAGQSLTQMHGSVYAVIGVKVKLTWNGTTEEIDFVSTGTGFLLDDGRFITARHVVEPWFFINPNDVDEGMGALNIIASNGGQVEYQLVVASPNGSKKQINGSSFRVDRSADQTMSITGQDGTQYNIKVAGIRDGTDWAVANYGSRGSIRANAGLSTRLQPGRKLYVLGYPQGIGIDGPNNITPQQTTAEVTQAGTSHGMINITGNIDHGNSGGPVFVIENGVPQVIGVVSSGVGDAMKFLIPMSAVPGR